MRKTRNNQNHRHKSADLIHKTLYRSMTKEKNDKNAIAAFKTPPYQKRNTTSGKEKKKVDVRVNSISEVDTSELKLPLLQYMLIRKIIQEIMWREYTMLMCRPTRS